MKKINKNNIKNGDIRRFFINHEFNYLFGMPGCGKSTTLAVVAQVCYEMGIPCFSSFPVEHTYRFNGFKCDYPSGSVFIFDEIYDIFGCGQSKTLPPDVTMFFKQFRHGRYTIWAASQESDDAARRIRGVVTRAYKLSLTGFNDNYTRLSECVLRERADIVDGDKYEYVVQNTFFAWFAEYSIYRPDFYSDFDSYCRTYFNVPAGFKPW